MEMNLTQLYVYHIYSIYISISMYLCTYHRFNLCVYLACVSVCVSMCMFVRVHVYLYYVDKDPSFL